MNKNALDNDTCFHCGASIAIHSSELQRCPLNGREEIRPGHKQMWATTFFLPRGKELVRRAAPELLDSLKAVLFAYHENVKLERDELERALSAIDKAEGRVK